MRSLAEVCKDISEIVPGIEVGDRMEYALELILKELKRLKEIEFNDKGLCK